MKKILICDSKIQSGYHKILNPSYPPLTNSLPLLTYLYLTLNNSFPPVKMLLPQDIMLFPQDKLGMIYKEIAYINGIKA